MRSGVRRWFQVAFGSSVLLVGACSSSDGGGTPPASGSSAGNGGGAGSAGAAGSAGTGAAGTGGTAGAGKAGSGGASGCVPKPKIVACWAGDASMPPGPGTKSLSRCREYTGDDGSGPKQWDASCHPDATTHAIDACPAGFTSRCVTNCGTTMEYVDYNYDGGGSQLICQGSGAAWLMP